MIIPIDRAGVEQINEIYFDEIVRNTIFEGVKKKISSKTY